MGSGPGQAINLSKSKLLPGQLSEIHQQCLDKFANFTYQTGVKYCDTVHDSFLCWGPAPAGTVSSQPCPAARLSDTTQMAFRLCGESGQWLGRRPIDITSIGWTNFTPCFPPEVKNLFGKVDEATAQLKFEIAFRTRHLEMIGFSISLLALIISLFIMTYFRSLRNNRTKIHMNLFGAMIVQVVIRLILYINQAYILTSDGDHFTYTYSPIFGISNMPYLCEVAYALLEYTISVTFMWMFVEGLYLNNLVSTNTLREQISYKFYFIIGWILPLLITIVWAVFTGMHYRNERVKHCWYGYNFLPIYWIVQGPRLAVVIVNFLFLLNILRVLVIKMRRSENTELDRVRKAVRAAIVLLPLLGITNALDMWEAPLDGSVWQFGLWSYTTYFLRSFQGFFIALLYCFLNAEVRAVIRKHYENWRAMRETRRRYAEIFRANGVGLPPAIPTRRAQVTSESTEMIRWPRQFEDPRDLPEMEAALSTYIPIHRTVGTNPTPDVEQSGNDCYGQCVVTIEHEYNKRRSAIKAENMRRNRWLREIGEPSEPRNLPEIETSLTINIPNRRSVGTDPPPDEDQSGNSCYAQCVATIEDEYNRGLNESGSAKKSCWLREIGEPSEPRNLPDTETSFTINIPNRRSLGTDPPPDEDLPGNSCYGQCVVTVEDEYNRRLPANRRSVGSVGTDPPPDEEQSGNSCYAQCVVTIEDEYNRSQSAITFDAAYEPRNLPDMETSAATNIPNRRSVGIWANRAAAVSRLSESQECTPTNCSCLDIIDKCT